MFPALYNPVDIRDPKLFSFHEPVLFKFIKTEKVKKQKPKSERKDDPRFFHTKKADWGRINKEKYEALESLEKHKREIG